LQRGTTPLAKNTRAAPRSSRDHKNIHRKGTMHVSSYRKLIPPKHIISFPRPQTSRCSKLFQATSPLLRVPLSRLTSGAASATSAQLKGVARSNRRAPKDAGKVVPAERTSVDMVVKALTNGKVVSIPTDTLYGLAASATNSTAMQALYDIKGRASDVPLAICVADIEDVGLYGHTSHLPAGLLAALLPGPVTLLLTRRVDSPLSPELNPGVPSIGVRIPEASFIRDVARGCGTALALTSANVSGRTSTVAVHEFRPLWEHCAYVCDGGDLGAGRSGSTIVDISLPGRYIVLRDGSALAHTTSIVEAYGLVAEKKATT